MKNNKKATKNLKTRCTFAKIPWEI